jgi:formylmethanofuran dehydrogenase subunit E
MNTDYPHDLQQAIEFHGHFCPGLAIGYRAAKAALEKLQVTRADDEEIVAIVETDACGIDALQSLLGCTMGKGNLIYKDHGKQAYTVASRRQNKAVRLALLPDALPQPPGADELRAAVFDGTATDEQRKKFQQMQQARIGHLLAADTEKLFKIEWVATPLPQPARIFKSVVCGFCGEAVMEPRARLQDGKIACLPCHEEYTRGW